MEYFQILTTETWRNLKPTSRKKRLQGMIQLHDQIVSNARHVNF